MCLNPIYMMLASAVCCSYAFMLPIATAPNAIVFGNSTLRTIGNDCRVLLLLFKPIFDHQVGITDTLSISCGVESIILVRYLYLYKYKKINNDLILN